MTACCGSLSSKIAHGLAATRRKMPLLAFIYWSGLVGCATGPEHSRGNKKVYPEDTPERVSLTPAEVKAAVTPANAYYLSVRERKLCVKRAAKGDIVAAGKLARFYVMHHEGPRRTLRDDEKADYWQRVVARLYDADRKARPQK
jgi:hypothetical protein